MIKRSFNFCKNRNLERFLAIHFLPLTFEKIFFMRFEKPVPIIEIARLIGAKIVGEEEGAAMGINEIHKVEEGDLVFVDHPKYYRKCIESAATYIIINQVTEFPPHKALLLVDQPFEAYQKIASHYRPFEASMKIRSDSAQVGENSLIMPGA